MYDITIIGAGPAGLTSAIYACQARKNVLVLESASYGGQILKANKVKNYPGFEEISGYDFANKLYEQAKLLGACIKFEEVIKIKNNENFKEIFTKDNSYKTKAIIIATGAQNRKLGINNEDELIGKGVSYCATCDGMFFKDKVIAITGGGNQAIDDALYLSGIAKKVYMIYRRKEFRIDSINLDKLKKKENVSIILNTNITDIIGKDKVTGILIKENEKDEVKNLDVDALFIAIGHIPVSSICENLIETTPEGYIEALEDCKTNVDGIFAAGDIRKKEIRQLTTACSDGTIASLNACKYINDIEKNH